MNEQEKPMEQVGMDETVAAEIERRVREEVQRARAEWETEQAQADAERERVAGMSDDERERYALSRREAALDERERIIAERELRAMALEQLSQRGLPRELAEALPYESEERCLAGLDALEQAFRRAVQEGVDERLRGRAPSLGAAKSAESMSDAEYYMLGRRM
mgnify:FL=1